MKKIIFLFFIIICSNIFGQKNLKNKSLYDKDFQVFIYENRTYMSIWDLNNKVKAEIYNNQEKKTNIKYNNNKLQKIYNVCYDDKINYDIKSYECGKSITYSENGYISNEICLTRGKHKIIDNAIIGKKCGTEIQYQPDGTKKIIEHKRKCKDPCELHLVKRHQGLYAVLVDALRVREKPSDKAKTIFTIYKDQEVELLEDTQIFFKVDFYVAPWVKIKTKDGRIGYVYGAFLKTKELYVEPGE